MLSTVPILDHPVDSPTAFTPDALIDAVRSERNLPVVSVPEVCILEFDGDLTDRLVADGSAVAFDAWPCFHTRMYLVKAGGCRCGIVARTIGGPYAVLVAEQLAACGARLIVGLTSAGRVSATIPVPSVVVADRAVRDEGTSYHYLPADEIAVGSEAVAAALESEIAALGLPVTRGTVWTTDAPYRETEEQLLRHAKEGVLAVEMQAASLFAFSAARGVPVGVVAHVTNAIDHCGDSFDKGAQDVDRLLLDAIGTAGAKLVEQAVNGGQQI